MKISKSQGVNHFKMTEYVIGGWKEAFYIKISWKIWKSQNLKILIFWYISKMKWDFEKLFPWKVLEFDVASWQIKKNLEKVQNKNVDI